MNNAKISVLACLTLALCAFGSVEAKDKSTKKGAFGSVEAKDKSRKKDSCKCDPIVAVWNIVITDPAQSFTTQYGVATFFCDGTAIFATIPANPEAPSGNDTGSSTQSYGTWTKCGPCEYTVDLSSVNNEDQGSFPQVARVQIPTLLTIRSNGMMFDITGTFVYFNIDSQCLTQDQSATEFRGTGCKLGAACCPPKTVIT